MSTREHEALNRLLPPAEQRAIVDRGLAADAVRRATRDAWFDPGATSDRILRAFRRLAARRGLSTEEIDDIEATARGEAAGGA